ncbi:hypothetical protein cand_025350 [Cryptosporidium andersoni]|uniref:Uncharacterized protein n=1 Tax=Cryptosporidium andersoni TaxID=117008 RepID=A0A1J4MAX1_9CRYT|nr:hypothetical protein cand_025350 [Cryptosporidium andersoni]
MDLLHLLLFILVWSRPSLIDVKASLLSSVVYSSSIRSNLEVVNPWTVGTFIRLRLEKWSPLFDNDSDEVMFKDTLKLCINRGLSFPQPIFHIRILEYERSFGLIGFLIEFPKSEVTSGINRVSIYNFLMQCRKDKFEGEAHIALPSLLRNVVQMPAMIETEDSENYTLVMTLTIVFLAVTTSLSVISIVLFVILSTRKNTYIHNCCKKENTEDINFKKNENAPSISSKTTNLSMSNDGALSITLSPPTTITELSPSISTPTNQRSSPSMRKVINFCD